MLEMSHYCCPHCMKNAFKGSGDMPLGPNWTHHLTHTESSIKHSTQNYMSHFSDNTPASIPMTHTKRFFNKSRGICQPTTTTTTVALLKYFEFIKILYSYTIFNGPWWGSFDHTHMFTNKHTCKHLKKGQLNSRHMRHTFIRLYIFAISLFCAVFNTYQQ